MEIQSSINKEVKIGHDELVKMLGLADGYIISEVITNRPPESVLSAVMSGKMMGINGGMMPDTDECFYVFKLRKIILKEALEAPKGGEDGQKPNS